MLVVEKRSTRAQWQSQSGLLGKLGQHLQGWCRSAMTEEMVSEEVRDLRKDQIKVGPAGLAEEPEFYSKCNRSRNA